jgi:hypothetical protein
MKIPTIKEALELDDDGLSEFLGQPNQLQTFRKELQELSELKGPAKEEAERMWLERFTPRVDSDSLRWMKEDAIRHSRTPEEVLKSTSTDSVF